MHEAPKSYTILFYQSKSHPLVSVAHCLELDIVATGDTMLEAGRSLLDVMQATVNEWKLRGKTYPIICKAPQSFWDIQAKADLLPDDLKKELLQKKKRPVGSFNICVAA